jgi:hypothetical protein
MIYFEDEFLTVKEMGAGKISSMIWKGLAKAEDYRNGYDKFLEMLQKQEKPNGLWLFDFTYGRVIDMKDQQWTINEWIPRLLGLSNFILKRIAVIPSSDVFNKVAARIIMNKIAQASEIEISYFENQDDASVWLFEGYSQEEEVVKIEE